MAAVIVMTSRRARREPMDVRCGRWESRHPTATAGERKGRHDRYSIQLAAADDPGVEGTLARAATAVERYAIYPPRRMRSLVCSPDGRVGDGVLIVQRILFGPFAMEAAVRVVDVFGSPSATPSFGFSYVTLEGHAERGVATFLLVRDELEGLSFNIESWSRPEPGPAVAMAPLARRLQTSFTREALAHVRASALGRA